MAKLVLRTLPEESFARFRTHLSSLPADTRPLWAVVARQPSLGAFLSGAKMYVLWLTRDHIRLARAYPARRVHDAETSHAHEDLRSLRPKSGMLVDSLDLGFADGTRLKLRDIAKGGVKPIVAYAEEGVTALVDTGRWSDEQQTNFYMDLRRAGLLAEDPLGGEFEGI